MAAVVPVETPNESDKAPPVYPGYPAQGNDPPPQLIAQSQVSQQTHAYAGYPQPSNVTTANTTIVMQQQQSQRMGGWSTGLFGCFADIPGCLCGWFCPCVLACNVATRMNETCLAPTLCCFVGNTAMRTKLRGQHNIPGDIFNDGLMICLCCECALCQMDRELKRLGYAN